MGAIAASSDEEEQDFHPHRTPPTSINRLGQTVAVTPPLPQHLAIEIKPPRDTEPTHDRENSDHQPTPAWLETYHSISHPSSTSALPETAGTMGLGRHTTMQLLRNVVISKKFLRTRKIMVMHRNERGECCPCTLVDRVSTTRLM